MPHDAHCNSSIEELCEVTLRFLVPEDIEQVKELCHEWFPVEYPSFWYECITETNQYYALAAIHDDIIVGLLVAQTKPLCDVNEEDAQLLRQAHLLGGNVGYILTLGVRRQHRRQGLASLLLNQYIEHLRLDCSRKYAKHRRPREGRSRGSQGSLDGDGYGARQGRRSPAGHGSSKNRAPAGGVGDSRRNNVSGTTRIDNDSGSEKNNTESNERTVFDCDSKGRHKVQNLNGGDSLMAMNRPGERKDTAVVIDVGMGTDDTSDRPSSRDNSTLAMSDEYSESGSQTAALLLGRRAYSLDLGVDQFSSEVRELSLHNSRETQGNTLKHIQNNSVINTSTNFSLNSSSCSVNGMSTDVDVVHPCVIQHRTAQKEVSPLGTYQSSIYSMPLDSTCNYNETLAPQQSAVGASIDYSSSRSSVEITMESDAPPVMDGVSEPVAGKPSSLPLGSTSNCSESVLSSADSLLIENRSEVLTSTISASYIVETSLLCSSVLQRVQCNDEVYAAAPVTAVLLHVLTTNASAIRFYTSRHFARHAFLPMFYVINNERRDGYSYVLYINGGQPPAAGFSLFPRPLHQIARPLGSSLSHLTQPLAEQVGKMSQWLLSGVGGSGGGGLLSVLVGGMVGVLGKVVSSVVTVGRRA